MKKEFGFDGKSLAVLAAGLCVIMFLTFAAGVVTGIALWTPTRKELAALKNQGQSHGPVETAHAAPPPVVPAAATPPPPQSATLAPVSTPPPPAPAEPPKAVEPAPQQPAATTVASAAPPAAPATPEENANLFSLQLGSFLDVKNARQLQTDLKERGYNTIIFTALDGEQREWHVVRIGGFKTMASAAHAAADFSGKERIPAWVRRSDRL